MNCEEIVANLSLIFDGEIEAHFKEEFKKHLQKCAPCQAVWNTFKKTIELFRSYGKSSAVSVSDDMHERLISNLKRNMS